MQRAFLCHSSDDKEYVQVVASKLTRARVVFDEFSFQAGQDFREEIRHHLSDGNLFVFIASRRSLESSWCKFELDEAELQRMSGGIAGQITLIVDQDVSFKELPNWLSRSRALIQPRPSQAARDIEFGLIATQSLDDRRPLVGRELELKQIREEILQFGSVVPRILLARGLPGVGRRSLLERATFDNLDLRFGPYFEVDRNQRLEDLYLFLVDETGDLETRRRMAEALAAFRELEQSSQSKEICNKIDILCDNRSVPTLIDAGGLLNDEGAYQVQWQAVIEEFSTRKSDRYIGLIHRRRPYIHRELDQHVLIVDVSPLDPPSTETLLRQIFKRSDTEFNSGEVKELAEYVAGYPPAAYAADALARRYGLDHLLVDKTELVDFKAKTFQRFVHELQLSDIQWTLLRFLGNERPLTLNALRSALGWSDEELSETLKSLIDLSLINIRDRAYFVSSPIKESIFRVHGFLGTDFYRDVANRMTEEYWKPGALAPPLAVIDATLHAVAMADIAEPTEVSSLVRVSTVEQAAGEYYNRADYEKALQYATRCQDMHEGDNRNIRELRYKCLVRLEKWTDAEEQLREIEASADRRYWFLKGFGLRRRGLVGDAEKSFNTALKVGDRSISVFRELAFCQYAGGRYGEARKSCLTALGRDNGNAFLLDLLVKINLAMEDFVAASDALKRLESVDVLRKFIYHRRASYFAKRKNYDAALHELNQAIEGSSGLFEAYAMKVGVLINAEKYPEAEDAMRALLERFPHERHDVKIGLQVKSLARQGSWQEAYIVWHKLHAKDLPVHQALLKSILLIKSEDPALTIDQRNHAKDQARLIASDLAVVNDILNELLG
ncbi:TIR domain-containing protein [Amycolatopsis sp. NPDC049159]|uniref:TIR domain-containing protein n=1 Tax=Amycolatopsis sp. NPDC049159 TaxID=3157210 RepID=UPI0033F31799